MADQESPIARRVALKVIKPGLDTVDVIARFEAERQALARMDHPNIAKVLDAGTTASGRPYFVMELVKGVPITEYADQAMLTPRQRLELMVPVCHAVQHAHQKGIVHRDLKPSNVLVACFDEVPVPKIIDFGVAKAIGQKLTQHTLFTRFGQVVGTLEYMSPEQARLNQLDVDTRSDVYALGVLIYELVTGSTPVPRDKIRELALDEVLKTIREVEPDKPSQRLSTSKGLPVIAHQRSSMPEALGRFVRHDLDWITMKALEKDRSRRYQDVGELAADLRRFLDGQPVLAGPPSAAYVLRKYVYRHSIWFGAAGLLAAALMVGVVGISIGLVQARRSAETANAAKDATQAALGRWQAANDQLKASQARLRRDVYALDMRSAGEAWKRGDWQYVDRVLQRYDPADGEEDLRQWEWYYLNGLAQRRRTATAIRLPLAPYRIGISPNGKWMTNAHDRSRTFTLLNLDTGDVRQFGQLQRYDWNPSFAVFSPDGAFIAYPDEEMESVQLLDVATGTSQVVRPAVPHDMVRSAAFSPDGSMLAVVSNLRGLELIALASRPTGREAVVCRRFEARSVGNNLVPLSFSPDGRSLVNGLGDTALHVWNVETWTHRTLLEQSSHVVDDARYSPDGRFLASASRDGLVRIWNATTLSLLRELPNGSDEARALAFSPAGDLLAIGMRNRKVVVRSVPGFEVVDELVGYEGMYALEFAPNGDLWFGGQNSEIVCYPSRVLKHAVSPRLPEFLSQILFAEDGRIYCVALEGRIRTQVHVLSVQNGRESVEEQVQLPFPVSRIADVPPNLLLAAAGDEIRFAAVDLQTHALVDDVTIDQTKGSSSIAVTNTGNLIALGGTDGYVTVWERNERRLLWTRPIHTRTVACLAFSPNGDLLASGSTDGTLFWLNPIDGAVITDLGLQELPVASSAFSPDGKSYAVGLFGPGYSTRRLALWDVATGASTPIPGHPFPVNGVAFLNDGRSLVTVGADQTLRINDRHTGRERLILDESPHIFQSVAISADDRMIAAGCRDGTVLVYRASKE